MSKLHERTCLSFKLALPTLVEDLTSYDVTVGGSVTIGCNGTGRPAPACLWYINARPVNGKRRS
jgi:hypothetical protein